MTRSSTEIWNEIKNSPLNTGITTGKVRLNYWDGRDVFEGEYVSADYVTINAADISETQIHFKENGHYGSSRPRPSTHGKQAHESPTSRQQGKPAGLFTRQTQTTNRPHALTPIRNALYAPLSDFHTPSDCWDAWESERPREARTANPS